MAIHPNTASLLHESLPEFLSAAKYCLRTRKSNGGFLGYPAAALMFAIADAIGSYHRGNQAFRIKVDGKDVSIANEGFHHFYIFNSHFYGLNLSELIIKKLYANHRNSLLHNAALAHNHALVAGRKDGAPFFTNTAGVHVDVLAFLRVSGNAVKAFLPIIESVVPGSEQNRIIGLKK